MLYLARNVVLPVMQGSKVSDMGNWALCNLEVVIVQLT